MRELRTIYPYGLNHDTGKWIQYGDYVTGHEYEGHTLTKTVNQLRARIDIDVESTTGDPFWNGKGSKLVLIMRSPITFPICLIC